MSKEAHPGYLSRRKFLTLATVAGIGAITAGCTKVPEEVAKEPIPTSTPVETPQLIYGSAELEAVDREVLTELRNTFDKLYSAGDCDSSSMIETEEEIDSDSNIIHRSLRTTIDGITLEMSHSSDLVSNETSYMFARFYVAGDLLPEDERREYESSDNPSGNKYLNSIKIQRNTYLSENKIIMSVRAEYDGGIFAIPYYKEDGFDYRFSRNGEEYSSPSNSLSRMKLVAQEVENFAAGNQAQKASCGYKTSPI